MCHFDLILNTQSVKFFYRRLYSYAHRIKKTQWLLLRFVHNNRKKLVTLLKYCLLRMAVFLRKLFGDARDFNFHLLTNFTMLSNECVLSGHKTPYRITAII